VGVAHRLGQLARGAAGVLEHRHVVGGGPGFVSAWIGRERGEEGVVGNDHAQPGDRARHFRLFGVGDQNRGLAVVDPQPQRVGAEQGEHRNADRSGLHRPEQADVKRQARLQHERNPLARRDSLRVQPVGEARGPSRNLVKAQSLVAPITVCDPHRRAARTVGVAGDALVADVETLAIPVEQLP
jgi:hypothetical protein